MAERLGKVSPRAWTTVSAILVTLALSVAAVPAQKSRKSRPQPAPKPAKASTFFQVGENLDYRVAWASFLSAASVRLSVAERRDLYGWDAWHFRAVAHTLYPVRTLFVIDDQFDSYTDSSTLESRQFEMHLREQGKQQDTVAGMAAAGAPARGDGPSVVVLPGTRDPVGALYSLREVDWQSVSEFRAPVYDGKNLYEMRARMALASTPVSVAAGTFSASKIEIHLFDRGKEVPETRFEVWLAQEKARAPVLIEAEVPFGTLRAELTAAAL